MLVWAKTIAETIIATWETYYPFDDHDEDPLMFFVGGGWGKGKPAWPQSPSVTPWHRPPLPSSCLQPSWPPRSPAWAKSTYSFKVKGIIRSARSTLIWDCKIGLPIVLNLVQFQNILHLLSW